VEFRILGPLEVRAGGRAVPVPGAKPRAVLALLVLNAGRAVTAEQLATALWGEEAPAGAVNTVQVNISRVRKALGGADVLATTPGGYELRADAEEVDALRFERRVAQARAEPDEARRLEILEEALGMWRGAPLADLAYEPFAQPEIARLEEQRVAAFEELAEAKLALGPPCGGRRRAGGADRPPPLPRAAARAADARAVPLRPAGRRAAGLP
jgi:DNA-binding SARP family transcriptional activator